MPWSTPSPRVQELIRQGAGIALHVPEEWMADLDTVTLSGAARSRIADDPVLAEATRRTNRANLLTWAAANVRAPGEPVTAQVDDAQIAVARDMVRRGLDEAALDAYRAGQSVAWRYWMKIVFALTRDPAELEELLDVTSQSISAFVDDVVTALATRMRSERAELTRGSQAERREVIALLLEGAPITRERAESRLGYALERTHHAAVVWSEGPDPDVTTVDHVAEILARPAGGEPSLMVSAGSGTRWVWSQAAPDLAAVEAAADAAPDVRVALAGPAHGVTGFRRTHLDALTAQRMLARLGSTRQVAYYDAIALVALATEDSERAARFVSRTLGGLEHADIALRESVSTYVRSQSNATRAAELLYTHRNTLLRRLERAEEALPRPLADNPVDVAVALDIVHWRGAGGHAGAR
ncbi:PucR family transcriptional regulator [Tomitella gaofuii]|uniref:PucR family transcriptional regulator n=1 Tax=Tomitella gaofuii TaxID=2760083 RepID=UPI0015FDBD20|nr:PucR family transcriptional regulator [Tomitella gaofuii]